MTVKDIFDFLNSKFPVETSCDFDNTGILTGNPDNNVTSAIIALDCTHEVITKALEYSCQLIITHHPLIFHPLKSVLAGTVVYDVIKNGLSVISMHTNLDIGDFGVNDSLCSALSLTCVESITADDGFVIKTARLPKPLSADECAFYLKSKLNGSIKYVGCNKAISKVLVCSGSGGTYFNEVFKNDCDALITAEVKHNVFIDAEKIGVAVFDAGHFNTEDVVVEPLKLMLSNKFPETYFYTDHSSSIKSI